MVMQQIHDWGSRGLVYPVAVNILAINLQDKAFPETVCALIAEYDIPSHLLDLEVTETAIMKEPLVAIENIRNLSASRSRSMILAPAILQWATSKNYWWQKLK